MRPYSHKFVFPTAKCEDRVGVIIEQDMGTFGAWFGHKCEHTNSVEQAEAMKEEFEGRGLKRELCLRYCLCADVKHVEQKQARNRQLHIPSHL